MNSDPQVVITAWQETGKTIRWGLACAAFVLGIVAIVWGVVQINAKDEPWWKILLFTAAPPLSLVGTTIVWLRRWVTKRIDNLSARNRRLESSIDTARDSSELLEDGTHPHDE
jgi:hypothetical protein